MSAAMIKTIDDGGKFRPAELDRWTAACSWPIHNKNKKRKKERKINRETRAEEEEEEEEKRRQVLCASVALFQ